MATDDAGTTISSAPNMSQCTQKCKWCSRGTCPVDATKYHACHVKRRWMSPSATPATPTAAASPCSTPTQARHRSQCHFSEAQIHEHRQLQQHYQRWRHRSVLDLPSDCGKCSNVAPTESRQHKNSGNRLHSDTKLTEETCNCCLTGMQLLSNCMPSNGYRSHRYQNITSNRNMSHQSSWLTMPSGHLLFECDAIISGSEWWCHCTVTACFRNV